MMKSPIKKKTLLSLVSVMLCLIMLAGTAYAYFEYRVTNYGNKITIGGVAAELLKYDETSSQYQNISNGTAGIFNDVTMQAGNTEIVYLQVKNTGTLPLYYDLVLNISVKDAGGAAADLSSVLQYAVAEDKQAPATLTWSDFAFPVGMTNGKHMPIIGNALAADDSEYLALAVNLAESNESYSGYTIEIDAEVVTKDVSTDLLNGDGDFEDGVTYVKSDIKGGTWVVDKDTYLNPNADIVSGTETGPAPSGEKYLQQDGNGNTGAYVRYGTKIPVTPGKTYQISYKIKRDNSTTNKSGNEHDLLVQAYIYDAEDTDTKTMISEGNKYAESQGQWISKTGTVTAPEGASYVIIRFSGNQKIQFSIDDIKFYEVTATE